ncbi:hypothetical protein HDU76_001940 [Blyttiomyces sp. JEL0837]|nr:hypothetical protein HDU76_001940 [Blyttiomyces sp. JEL0837]
MSSLPVGSRTVVARPDQVHLPDYEDLTLLTPDMVKIRAYAIKYRVPGTLSTMTYEDSAASDTDPDNEYMHDPVHAGLRMRKKMESGAMGKSSGQKPLLKALQPREDVSDVTVLYLHANAGNMGHRLPIARLFHGRFRCNVFMLSYRGYGLSQGTASEKGIRIDAQTALDFIKKHPELGKTKVVLYGQSIGGAVAIDLASRNPDKIAAIILENTFLSLPRLIPNVMPFLKYFTFLCHQKWNSAIAIEKIPESVPILMLSGGRDELIPQEHMVELTRLAREARGGPSGVAPVAKKSGGDGKMGSMSHGAVVVNCGVGEVQRPGYFDEVEEFWRKSVVKDFKSRM